MTPRSDPLPIPGAAIIEAPSVADGRGSFTDYLRAGDLPGRAGLAVAQVSCSVSRRGALRGIAVTSGQEKTVACVTGEILDVAVDLRTGSPAFGTWHARHLGAGRRAAIVLPPGVGHAFMALADDSAVLYLLSAPRDPEREQRVNPLDPTIGIDWPGGIRPVMSPRDTAAPGLDDAVASGLLTSYSARHPVARQEDG